METSTVFDTLSLAKRTAEANRRIQECIETQSTTLDLSDLGLRAVPEKLRELNYLRSLDLLGNSLRELPHWFSELKVLRILMIGGGKIPSLPTAIRDMPRLRKLSFVRTKTNHIPAWISQLSDLRFISFAHNPIERLPAEIVHLTRLTALSFDDCQLRELPTELIVLSHLKELYIRNNPLLGIPDEIAHTREAKRILRYYSRISNPLKSVDRPRPLNEFKLVLVGRGGVGKTTLAHKLITNKFVHFSRTDGISISDWEMQCGKDKVTAHVWDFGGQEIMHGTHRFFITSRSLYLILISGRENAEDTDAEYWLSLVRSLAGDVPVIIVLNRFGELPFELNRRLLKDKFGDNIKFVECDALENLGIESLRSTISAEASAMAEVRKSFPAEWVKIKNELPKQKCDWMPFDDFIAFCASHGETDEDACEELASFLHDLGLMLFYRDDERLRRLGVLNPHWVTQGIYRIITAPELRGRGGKVTIEDFKAVLDPAVYPKKLHSYLLNLMRKFELCFPLDDSATRYLVPELLTKEEPPLGTVFKPSDCIGFIYRYETALPHGLLPRFIVHTYVHRTTLIWRSGVVLQWGNARALVRGDIPGCVVSIWVTGPRLHCRTLLEIIRTHFERIHESYKELPVYELVPVPGHPNIEVPYSTVLKFHHYNRDTIDIDMGKTLGRVLVKDLLENVGFPSRDVSGESAEPLDLEPISNSSALSIFISYSHIDETYCDQLRGALTIYQRGGELDVWDDTKIIPGQRWEREILYKLEEAQIIVLLLSNDFIRSDYCTQVEMRRAIEREARGECSIVSIVVRACRFDKLQVGKLQAILPNGKPIKNHRDRDTAWKEVTNHLDKVIHLLNKKIK